MERRHQTSRPSDNDQRARSGLGAVQGHLRGCSSLGAASQPRRAAMLCTQVLRRHGGTSPARPSRIWLPLGGRGVAEWRRYTGARRWS